MSDHFRTFAERAAHAVGSYWAFMLALLVVRHLGRHWSDL